MAVCLVHCNLIELRLLSITALVQQDKAVLQWKFRLVRVLTSSLSLPQGTRGQCRLATES